jgi:hypothetical protein
VSTSCWPTVHLETAVKHKMNIITPFNGIFYSASNNGKTSLAIDLIKNQSIFDKKFDEIYYVYTRFNPRFRELPNVKFTTEIPELKADGKNKLLVCDDILVDKTLMEKLVSIFLVDAHHTSTSCWILIQSLTGDKHLRTLSINTHVFFIFRHLRDTLSINRLFTQIGMDTRYLKAAYKAATKEKYTYLCINLQQGVNNALRLSSNILSKHPKIFLPKAVETPYAVPLDE